MNSIKDEITPKVLRAQPLWRRIRTRREPNPTTGFTLLVAIDHLGLGSGQQPTQVFSEDVVVHLD